MLKTHKVEYWQFKSVWGELETHHQGPILAVLRPLELELTRGEHLRGAGDGDRHTSVTQIFLQKALLAQSEIEFIVPMMV